MPYLGIDVGEKRVGVSATDALGITVQPLDVYSAKSAVLQITNLIQERNIKTVVIGMPYNAEGNEGFAAEKVKKFKDNLVNELQKKSIKCEIVFWDESFTTKKAQKWLHEGGLNTKKSRGLVDKLAATALLEDYLSAR